MINLLIVLNLVLCAASGVFIIKYLFANFMWSKSTTRNIVMGICIAASLLMSFNYMYTGFIIQGKHEQLEYDLKRVNVAIEDKASMPSYLQEDLEFINKITKEIITFTVAGYICFLISSAILVNTKAERNKDKHVSKWNLDKFRG